MLCVLTKSLQSCPTLRLYGLWPTRLRCPWACPGKNTGVSCHSLLQETFLTQGWNPHLLSPALTDEFTSATWKASSVRSVAQSCPTLCHPMECNIPGLPVHHQLPEFTQTHAHGVRDVIQPPLSSPSPPAFNLSQHHNLFQWVISTHQVAKVLELQLQYQSFQWIFRTDFL